MAMKIPEKIQVAGLIFTIKTVENLEKDELAAGVTLFDTQEILLEPTLSRQTKELTFLHELTHVIESVLGYRWDINGLETHSHDEVYINSFSTLWHQVVTQIVECQNE